MTGCLGIPVHLTAVDLHSLEEGTEGLLLGEDKGSFIFAILGGVKMEGALLRRALKIKALELPSGCLFLTSSECSVAEGNKECQSALDLAKGIGGMTLPFCTLFVLVHIQLEGHGTTGGEVEEESAIFGLGYGQDKAIEMVTRGKEVDLTNKDGSRLDLLEIGETSWAAG